MSEPTFHNDQTLPRTLDAYEPTTHFLARYKYRTDPEITEHVVEQTIQEGVILPTADADRYIFERDDGEFVWRVLVGVDREVFRGGEGCHYLLTVYADGVHDGGHAEVFDT